jgi:hypothetical protein
MSNLTFYTLDEVLAAGSAYSAFRTCLDSYPNVKPCLELIIANYGDWFGLWLDTTDMTDAQITAEKINQGTRWTSWLKTNAIYWNDYISRQSNFTGKQESTSKFLDTPETEADYSGDTHITNITKSTTETDNALGLETLRPVIETMVNQFRKTWLLPKEAI